MRSIELEGGSTITIKQGDITKEEVDIIVNAANGRLQGGGGVDGAIHRAAGPELLVECKKIRLSRPPLNSGEAVITKAGRLKAKYVIHAVGPVWQGGGTHERATLQKTYQAVIEIALGVHAKSIAFPAISTGVYGYPIDFAAPAAIDAIKQALKGGPSLEVRLILFSENDYKTYDKYLK